MDICVDDPRKTLHTLDDIRIWFALILVIIVTPLSVIFFIVVYIIKRNLKKPFFVTLTFILGQITIFLEYLYIYYMFKSHNSPWNSPA